MTTECEKFRSEFEELWSHHRPFSPQVRDEAVKHTTKCETCATWFWHRVHRVDEKSVWDKENLIAFCQLAKFEDDGGTRIIKPTTNKEDTMTAVNCETFRREWKEELNRKGEDGFQPKVEVLMHSASCESCQKWCDELFAEEVASLGPRFLQDLREALGESEPVDEREPSVGDDIE